MSENWELINIFIVMNRRLGMLGKLLAPIQSVPGSFHTKDTLGWHRKTLVTVSYISHICSYCWIMTVFIILTFAPRFWYEIYNNDYNDKHHESSNTRHIWPESVLMCWWHCMRKRGNLSVQDALMGSCVKFKQRQNVTTQNASVPSLFSLQNIVREILAWCRISAQCCSLTFLSFGMCCKMDVSFKSQLDFSV